MIRYSVKVRDLERTGTVRIDDICPECREDLGVMSLLGFNE
jgi:hypothetical protein